MADTNRKVVLIVEDEDLVARMYQAGLAHSSFQVQIARDGEDALLSMEQNIPDLVLLDIMMPKVNGMEVLDRMKADPKLKAIPVIMMSNLSGGQDKELAMSKGATDYWVKRDIQPREIEKRVTEILAKAVPVK